MISNSFTPYYTIKQIEGFFYQHKMVNHSETYRDPITGAHTNMIEGTWNRIKSLVPPCKRRKTTTTPCLHEFMWRCQNAGRLWEALLEALK